MDTEENNEIKHALRSGKHATDEGPYYHESWWESYKGGVKGKLGGVVIGAVIGAVVGIAAASILAFAGVPFIAVTAGFAAGGMIYGGHEFSEVGKVTGAVAAAHEKSEERMKSFENGKFAEIKQEISELKSLVTGKPVEPPPQSATKTTESEDYRTQHCDDHCPPQGIQLIFWKIAGIGLTVGLAAGALLAFGGASEHVLHALGTASEPLSQAGVYAASMATMGLFGASFGINRDVFRKIFDKTDKLFKGIVGNSHEIEKVIETKQPIVKPIVNIENPVSTIVYDTYADTPLPNTHHRDKVLEQARQALLSMDHTKAVPH